MKTLEERHELAAANELMARNERRFYGNIPPHWETELEIERTIHAPRKIVSQPYTPTKTQLLIALVILSVAIGTIVALRPDLAFIPGYSLVGAAFIAIVNVVVRNFKHIRRELR